MADFVNLNELLSQVDWNTVTEEEGFEDLPEGFYFCEVVSGELKTNKAGTNMQVSMRFKILENGVKETLNDRGYSTFVEIGGTKNRSIFKHYPFKDISGVKRFVTDMQKFEGDETGVPILEKEYFMSQEIIPDALKILEGLRIYVQATCKEKDGQKSTWYNILSWEKANGLGLTE